MTQRASTGVTKRTRKGSAPRQSPSTQSAQPSRWLRATSATFVYYNVRKDHVRLFPAKFREALDTYRKVDPHALHSYAQASSSTLDRCDVQCSFRLEGQKPIEIKSGTKRVFNFIIDGNTYEANKVTGDPLPGQDWQSIDVCQEPNSVEIHSLVTAEHAVALLAKLASGSDSAKTFFEVIRNNHLLIGPCTQQSEDRPCIFDYKECWRKTLDRVDVHAAISQSTDQGVVYRTDDSHQPIRADVERHRSLAWFQTVEGMEAFPQVPHFVENIPVTTLSEYVQVPGMLRNDINTVTLAGAGANFGPTGCSVDLHVDLGMHVLSTVFDNCIKLWVTYPPTPSNLDVFYAVSTREQKLKQLTGKLEGGVFAITTGGTAIHLPPGWLHATFNIKGGFLVGITWENYQDLTILLDIFRREAEAHPEDAEYSLIIRICETALEEGVRSDDLLATICPLWYAIRRVDACRESQRGWNKFAKPTWLEFLQRAGGKKAVCPGCKESFSLHNPDGRKIP